MYYDQDILLSSVVLQKHPADLDIRTSAENIGLDLASMLTNDSRELKVAHFTRLVSKIERVCWDTADRIKWW